MGIAIYVLAFAVLLVGLYAVIAKKNLIKIILGAAILDYALNMLLVLVGYRRGGGAPILSLHTTPADLARTAVDPLPQALVLTSIVIGLGITALLVAMALRLHEKYGTFDVEAMRKLRG
jgi:multicomponent Na+:H+ antiporter subunit C